MVLKVQRVVVLGAMFEAPVFWLTLTFRLERSLSLPIHRGPSTKADGSAGIKTTMEASGAQDRVTRLRCKIQQREALPLM